jgi:hypothetical protein
MHLVYKSYDESFTRELSDDEIPISVFVRAQKPSSSWMCRCRSLMGTSAYICFGNTVRTNTLRQAFQLLR